MESVREYSSLKIARNGREPASDLVMVEETIELIVNGTMLTSIVTTPDLHKELSVGFVVTEGAVKSRNDIEDVIEKDGRVFLKIRSFDHFYRCRELRSSGYIGMNQDKKDEDVILPVNQTFRIDVLLDSLKHLYDRIQDQTRGTHSATLADADGNLKYKALDIGRHNAIDKAVGMAVMNGDDLSKMFLISSGRQPGGMVMKAVRSGIPLVISKAAPISSGIDRALRSNITLCCFADKKKIKVFSAPERVEY
jgi:FdhD protein